MNEKFKQLIELIECFEPENKFYWINALKVSDTVKGKLVNYFTEKDTIC